MKFYAKRMFACTVAVWFVLPARGSAQADQDLLHAMLPEIKEEAIKKALAAGANVNTVFPGVNKTALMVAVERRNKAIVGLLLAHKADANVQDNFGKTAAHYAAAWEEVEILDALVAHGADLKIRDKEGTTALDILLFYGAANGSVEEVKKALSYGASVSAKWELEPTPLTATVLHIAATSVAPGAQEVVKLLLSKGANVSAEDENGDTPLHYAGMKMAEDFSVFDLLLTKGANPKIKDKKGMTPADMLLINAADAGNFKAMNKALQLGAYVNVKGPNGNTPAHGVAKYGKENKEDIIVLLKKHGADLTIKNKEGKTVNDLLAEAKKAK